MSSVRHPSPAQPRRRPPHRVIIARGEHIRTFTVRPWLIGMTVALGAIITVGYLGATGYLAFRDDLLATSIARQSSMQRTYEDKIASLRSDIDRLSSHQLLNQQDVQSEVDKLTSRQQALSDRQAAISGLTDTARAAGIALPNPPSADPAQPPAASVSTLKPGVKTSALVLPSFIGSAETADATVRKPPVAEISEVEAALDHLATAQVAYVDNLATSVVKRNDQIAAVLKTIGTKVPGDATAETDVGGPYIPLTAASGADTFNSNVSLVSVQIARFIALRALTTQLPLTVPVPDPQITSPFGERIDPFLGTPALHPGIDYRAAEGQPIGATAPGKVVTAAYGDNGGYGNMVDIDHGNGVVTRFGHLSEIDVKVGQLIAKGTFIGKAGDTGRATGPHLHYEVRVNDQPVDPATFIAAGNKLAVLF